MENTRSELLLRVPIPTFDITAPTNSFLVVKPSPPSDIDPANCLLGGKEATGDPVLLVRVTFLKGDGVGKNHGSRGGGGGGVVFSCSRVPSHSRVYISGLLIKDHTPSVGGGGGGRGGGVC